MGLRKLEVRVKKDIDAVYISRGSDSKRNRISLKEEEDGGMRISKKIRDELKEKKITVFIQVVGEPSPEVYKVVSRLYKIEVNVNVYNNPSPPRMTHGRYHDKLVCHTDLFAIEPVWDFKYPAGMTCVYFESKLYFVGGSVSYIVLNDSYPTKRPKRRDDLYNQVNENDPDMYPLNVYVFYCVTC